MERIRNPPRSRIQHEIRVTFSNQVLRDEFASRGKLLANHIDEQGNSTAGFRMDVPDFLSSDFKVFNDYGHLMRRTHGKSTRKYVKFDDDAFGLYLELRLPGAGSYLKIKPPLARSLIAEGERVEIDCFRGDLLARPQLDNRMATDSPLSNPNLIPLPPKSNGNPRPADINSKLLSLVHPERGPQSPRNATSGPGPSTWLPHPTSPPRHRT